MLKSRSPGFPLLCGLALAAVFWCSAAEVGGDPQARRPPGQVDRGSGPPQPPAEAGPGGMIKFRITRRPGQELTPEPGVPIVAGSTFAADPGEAVWTLAVNDAGEVVIHRHGVQVVKGYLGVKAAGGAPPRVRAAVSARTAAMVLFSGLVEGTGLKIQGWAQPVSQRELRLDLELIAAQPPDGLTGGLAWALKLDPALFGGRLDEPRLLLDRTGWRWPVGDGQEVMVRFDAPLDRLHFESGLKFDIRTGFIGPRLRPGRQRLGLVVVLPEGGRIVAPSEERYPRPEVSWYRQPLHWDSSPVDLSYLNAEDRPAGRHGFVRAEGDALVFQDGTPARFWGTNLAGPALFTTPRANIPRQARRIAQLGYNLVRIVQHEAAWVRPNIFGADNTDSRRLDPRALELLDLWIRCLKDEGVYVWLDLHYLRELKPADGVSAGWDEIARARGVMWGFNYVNPDVANLMKEFQHQYLTHVNRYTGLAYKDDPAVAGVLLTNENDLTFHFGLMFLANHNNPTHKTVFDQELARFAKATGLPADRLGRTWEPGPSKYFLSELEHRFNRTMIDALRREGVKAPIATTNLWGSNALFSLPPLAEGDVIDVHAYGAGEALGAHPRYRSNFLAWAAAAHVHGKPMTITEWNVPFPAIDRFTAPLYVASIASLQGWDAPMLYNYAQIGLERPGPDESSRRINKWSTFYDPALTGVMPAAAIAFRKGHISPARTSYCLRLDAERLFGTMITAENCTAIRTLIEQSRLTTAMPAARELPWLKAGEVSGEIRVVSDPGHDYLPAGADAVRSDTGELARDWKQGVQTIDTPRTQAVSGWIGGKALALRDATFEFQTKKAVVALTSIDDRPLNASRFLLITAVGQARPSPAAEMGKPLTDRPAEFLPFLCEPVVGTIRLRTQAAGLELLCLGPDGKVVSRSTPPARDGALELRIPAGRGTYWYVLKAGAPPGDVPAR